MADPLDAVIAAAQACAQALTGHAGQIRDLMPMLTKAQEALQPQNYTSPTADADRAALDSAMTGLFSGLGALESAAGDIVRAASALHLPGMP